MKGPCPVDLVPALDRFVNTLPLLHQVLAAPACSSEDRQLRAAMRRTALELAEAFQEAARLEPGSPRAAKFRAASIAAADLAATVTGLRRRGH